MAADPLEQVLRLVADGRLTADEAAPILAALDEPLTRAGGPEAGTWANRSEPSGGRGAEERPGDETQATALRIEVRDAGRNVVNVRLPLAVGRFALDRVPGLSAEQVERVREAMNSGFRGPVLVVDDDGDGVRISLD